MLSYFTSRKEINKYCTGKCAAGRYGGLGETTSQCKGPCDAGYFGEDVGRVESCEQCRLGFYSDSLGWNKPCHICPTGWAQDGGSTHRTDGCIACSAGQFFDNMTKTCKNCPSGRANSDVDKQGPKSIH